MQTKIIYEDDQVLVCHKPAGLATQSGRVGQADMVSELKKYLASEQCDLKIQHLQGQRTKVSEKTLSQTKGMDGRRNRFQEPYLGIIHRLDQPVEGLLVFAKTKEAAAKLTEQLVKGSLNKQYYAVVCGKRGAESGELVDYLVKDKDVARVSESGAADKEAKQAILQYKQVSTTVTAVSDEQIDLSLLDIRIDTGRFHQIRVQMSHAGLPLLGDSKYGSEQSLEISRKLGIRNAALYAYRVEFEHPKTGKKQVFQVEPKLPCGFGNIS
ncbi:MAG: RluA family pseudouridine synthase [Lachnospiraceae bacterium]|nr:RluA family pseudouridine synthase [Lachnospiraceae bacterium]